MNPFVDRLLANVPAYPISTDLVPALTLTGSGHISLTGETLYLTTNNKSYSFSLYNISVSQLAQQLITTGPTYFIGGIDGSMLTASVKTTLIQNGIVELLALENGQTNASLPTTLYLPSDGFYYVAGMIARVLEGRRRTGLANVTQINLQAATGSFLDWWGASTGLPRYQGEPDVLYAQRIIGMRFRPTQNNYSIMRLLKTLGYASTVPDTGNGTFSVNITVPASPPGGFVYSLGQIADIVNQVKSAGYQGTVVAQTVLTDTATVTDTVTASVASSTWTIGSTTVGQFTI